MHQQKYYYPARVVLASPSVRTSNSPPCPIRKVFCVWPMLYDPFPTRNNVPSLTPSVVSQFGSAVLNGLIKSFSSSTVFIPSKRHLRADDAAVISSFFFWAFHPGQVKLRGSGWRVGSGRVGGSDRVGSDRKRCHHFFEETPHVHESEFCIARPKSCF